MAEDEELNLKERVETIEMNQDELFHRSHWIEKRLNFIEDNQVQIMLIALVGYLYASYKFGGKLGEITAKLME